MVVLLKILFTQDEGEVAKLKASLANIKGEMGKLKEEATGCRGHLLRSRVKQPGYG